MRSTRLVVWLLLLLLAQRAAADCLTNSGYLTNNDTAVITFSAGAPATTTGTIATGTFTTFGSPPCSVPRAISWTCGPTALLGGSDAWLQTTSSEPYCSNSILALDVTACELYSVHANTITLPSTAAPVIGKLLGAVTMTSQYGYAKYAVSAGCESSRSTVYTTISSSSDCIQTLAASVANTTFSGGGLRCSAGSLTFAASSTFIFDALGDPTAEFWFYASPSFTISSAVTFVYVNGASANNLYFVAGSITLGSTTARTHINGTFVSSDTISLRNVEMTGKVITTTASSFGSITIFVGTSTTVLATQVWLNAPSIATLPSVLNPCNPYTIHAGTVTWSSTATSSLNQIGGLIAANSFTYSSWQYVRNATLQACFDATATAYAVVIGSPECGTTLSISYTSAVTFSGGGLRCTSTVAGLTFGSGAVVTFDGPGIYAFRVYKALTIQANVTFVYINGASSANVYFFAAVGNMAIGQGTIPPVIGGTFYTDSAQLNLNGVNINGTILAKSTNFVGMTTDNPNYINYIAPYVSSTGGNGPITSSTGGSGPAVSGPFNMSACALFAVNTVDLFFLNQTTHHTAMTFPADGLVGATNWGIYGPFVPVGLQAASSSACFSQASTALTVTQARTDCSQTMSVNNGPQTWVGGGYRCNIPGGVTINFLGAGTFILDGQGDPNAEFIFRASFITFSSGQTWQFINGASAARTFFMAGNDILIGSHGALTDIGGTFISDSLRVDGATRLTGQLLAYTASTGAVQFEGDVELRWGNTPVAASPQTDLTLSLTGIDMLQTEEEITAAVVAEAAMATGLSPLLFVIKSITTDYQQGTSVVIMRVPLDTARVLAQFVSSSPGGSVYPVFAHSVVVDLVVVVEPDAPLPYTPFDPLACDCQGIGSCYGGICGCTPTSVDVGECLPGTIPGAIATGAAAADQICVSRASNPTPAPDLCVSNLTTADAIVYNDTPCQQRMGPRSRNLFAPERLFCQSLDYSIGVDRLTFSGIFGDPATLVSNASASIYTFRSPQPTFAALVAAGIGSNSTRVTTDVYLSDIYPLHAAPTLSQFWVQIEFDALYTSQLNATSEVVVLLKRVTGRDTIEGAPDYYWHNNTWNAWVTAQWGELPPSAKAFWDPAAARPSWSCFRNHIYDASLGACVAACDNGFVGQECDVGVDASTCIVQAWNSTTMTYLSQSCDRVVCKPGYEQTWTGCELPPVVVLEVVVPETPESSSSNPITPVVAVSIALSVAAVIGLTVLAVSMFGASSAAATAAAAAGVGGKPPRIIHVKPTIKASQAFSELKSADLF